MVYATCMRILKNSHDAEEVTQDCFVILAQSTARIDSFIGPWLHRVATTRAFDRRKVDIRREARHARLTSLEPPTVHMDDLLEHVDAAIAALPDDARAIVIAHFLEGRSQQDIAQDLGLTQQAVSHRLKKGIDRLRETLRRRGVPVSAVAIASFFAENASAAMPNCLSAALEKLALAGTGRILVANGGASIGGGISSMALGGIIMKKTVLIVVLAVLVATFAFYASTVPKPAAPRPVRVDHAAPATPSINPAPNQIQLSHAIAPAASPAVKREPGEIADSADYVSISGTVSDTEGRPIQGAQVSIVAWGVEKNAPGIKEAATLQHLIGASHHISLTTSKPDGTFNIEGIRYQGRAFVAVNAQGYRVVDGRVGEVALLPGAEVTGLDFILDFSNTLQGIVLSPVGTPVGNATILCTDTGVVLRSQLDGTFSMGQPVDNKLLTFFVYHESYGHSVFGDMKPYEGARIELVLAGHATLHGKITTIDNLPASGYTIRLDGKGEQDGPTDNELPAYTAITDDNGDYAIDEIESRHYQIQVLGKQGTPASATIQLGFIDGGEKRSWDHVLKDAMTVHGTVRNEATHEPSPGTFVVWALDGKITGETQTDDSGAYSLELFACAGESVVAPLLTRPSYDKQLSEHSIELATSVDIQSGGTRQIDLILPASYSASVYFVDRDGNSVVDNIQVKAIMHDLTPGGASARKTVYADASGRFSYDGFQPGLSCYFEARPGESTPYISARSARFSAEVELVVQLHEEGRMVGRLLGPEGSVLRGASFYCGLTLDNGESYGPLSTTTNWNGYFTLEKDPSINPSSVPATSFRMTLFWHDENRKSWAWESGTIEVSPGETVDIGEVQVEEYKPA